MINSVLKKYSYQDFKLKYEDERIKQNELSVCKSFNVNFSSGALKPLSDFCSVFKSLFSDNDFETFLANTKELLDKLVYYTEYSFYLDEKQCFINRIFVVDNENKLYELNTNNLNFTYLSVKFKSNELYAFERDKFFYIVCPNNSMIYFRQESAPIFILIYCDTTSLEYFQDLTIFAVRNKKHEIYYTTDRNFDTSTSNLNYFSELQLESKYGEVLSVKKFGSAIYVVQQYAISKLNYSGEMLKVGSVTPISSKIIKNSIFILRDNLIFCTSGGVCLFDGVNLKYYFENEFVNLEIRSSSFTVYNDKYYFSYKVDNSDLIVELNVLNSTFNLYNIGKILNIYTIKTAQSYKLIVLVEQNEKYALLQHDEQKVSNYTKYIKFNKIIFDNSITKILSNLQIYSSGEYSFKITTDLSTIEFSVNDNLSLRNLGLQGNYFQMEILSNKNFNIEAIVFTLETYSEKL